jgi:hypothetical protein
LAAGPIRCLRVFTERDLVWILQLRLLQLIAEEEEDTIAVYNDYPMIGRTRADLALVDTDGQVLVAAEFKYEPSHRRTDIPRTKLPVVFWDEQEVGKDVERAREFVTGQGPYGVRGIHRRGRGIPPPGPSLGKHVGRLGD